jgi:hypothetical protein
MSSGDLIAMLHQDISKRGPQTMEASVARVMRKMLEQVTCSRP